VTPGSLTGEDLAQAVRVGDVVRGILGGDVIGVYLHGSAVLGGLRPGSDIDCLAVTHRSTTDDEKRCLIDELTRISRRGDPTVRSIELEVVVQTDVRPWRYPPRSDFKYGDWLGAEFDRGELLPMGHDDPDLSLLVTAVLRADRPIAGPPPAEVLDPVPRADVRRAVVDHLPLLYGWLDGDEANVTLTFARIWMTLETDRIVPKDVAADWVLERLPREHRPALEKARVIYLEGLGDSAWGDLLPRVRPHVDYVYEAIRRTFVDLAGGPDLVGDGVDELPS
jgi:streptomycin 3"-adenylyltransferase